MQIQEIEHEVSKLAPRERAIIAEHILESLEPKENYSDLWLEESKQRYKMFCEGKFTAISANDAFKKAFAALK